MARNAGIEAFTQIFTTRERIERGADTFIALATCPYFRDAKVPRLGIVFGSLLPCKFTGGLMEDATKRPIRDEAELQRLDAEARLLDDTSDGIDWDEITATTQPDFEAGRFAFNSADYPTEEAAMAAMHEFMQSVLDEVLRGIAARNSLDAARS
jgi:hypothetical protein